MKRLEILQLFSYAGEFDRFARNGFETQGSAASRITVESGQDAASDIQRLIKMRGDIDGFLSGSRIEHEQRLLRFDQLCEANQFSHQRFVHLQSASRIENERVTILGSSGSEGFARDFQHIFFAFMDVNWHLQLLAQLFKLIHCGGAVHIGGHQQRRAALFVQQASQFAARGGFARAVQAHH